MKILRPGDVIVAGVRSAQLFVGISIYVYSQVIIMSSVDLHVDRLCATSVNTPRFRMKNVAIKPKTQGSVTSHPATPLTMQPTQNLINNNQEKPRTNLHNYTKAN